VHIFGLLSEKKKDAAHETGYHVGPQVSSNRQRFLRERPPTVGLNSDIAGLMSSRYGHNWEKTTYFYVFSSPSPSLALSIRATERKQP
jgi:hypothetical protein